jgi:hypothetical protein
MASSLASRSFSLQDQIAFAKLSSDWNPMHLDQAFARRTQVGAPVVHAIHNLAWAADAVLRAFPIRVANIRARFLQPLFLMRRHPSASRSGPTNRSSSRSSPRTSWSRTPSFRRSPEKSLRRSGSRPFRQPRRCRCPPISGLSN